MVEFHSCRSQLTGESLHEHSKADLDKLSDEEEVVLARLNTEQSIQGEIRISLCHLRKDEQERCHHRRFEKSIKQSC